MRKRIVSVLLVFGSTAFLSMYIRNYTTNNYKGAYRGIQKVTEAYEKISTLKVTKQFVLADKIETVDEIKLTEVSENENERFDATLEFLAICVEAEAGNQDLLGKRLVVDVILNRVDSPYFPDDIISVITQENQFSSYTDGGMERVIKPSDETIEAVKMELDSRTDSQILYFTADDYNTYCAPAYKHGDHYFGYWR